MNICANRRNKQWVAKKLGNFKKDLNKLCIIYILFAQPLNIEDLIKRY